MPVMDFLNSLFCLHYLLILLAHLPLNVCRRHFTCMSASHPRAQGREQGEVECLQKWWPRRTNWRLGTRHREASASALHAD